jgi:small subunit ribosomal protein S16
VAVKLRLMRMGKKKQPTYRVVAADSRSPRDGRFIEIVGVYDPRPDPSAIRIDNDKAVDWLRKGAHPTESVRKLLEISGAWETFSGEAPSRPAPEPASKSTAKKAAAKSTAKKAPATTKAPAEAEAGGAPETETEAEAGGAPETETEADAEAAAEPEVETEAEAGAAAAESAEESG